MLGQRVLTAIILLAVLLPALFHPQAAYFNFLVLILIGAAGWEWGKLNGGSKNGALILGFFCLIGCAFVWLTGVLETRKALNSFWLGISVLWVVGSAILLSGGVSAWTAIPKFARLGMGPLVLVSAWLSVAQAKLIGVNFLLSIFLLVWVADIFAYFAGKAWGGKFSKTKLAPSISPGKSWEGVWGGVIGVLVLSQIWRWIDSTYATGSPSLFSILFEKGWLLCIALVLLLTAMSVAGDLVESLIKRSAGAKDSSGLLPGHGGVLDRVDALLPVFPISMWLYSL